jgi:hypothetical protein
MHFFAGSRGEISAASIMLVLPIFVPSLGKKCADVIAS